MLEYLFNKDRPATLLKRKSNTGVFLWTLRNFKNTFFYRTPPLAAFDIDKNPNSYLQILCSRNMQSDQWYKWVKKASYRNWKQNSKIIITTHTSLFWKYVLVFRGVFSALSNIYDGTKNKNKNKNLNGVLNTILISDENHHFDWKVCWTKKNVRA